MVRAKSVSGKPSPNGQPAPDDHLTSEESVNGKAHGDGNGRLDYQFAGRAKKRINFDPVRGCEAGASVGTWKPDQQKAY